MPRITELLRRCGDRLGVFCGCDTIALESLMVGAIGWVGGVVNVLPEGSCQALRAGVVKKNYPAARKLFFKMLPTPGIDGRRRQVHPVGQGGLRLAGPPVGPSPPPARPGKQVGVWPTACSRVKWPKAAVPRTEPNAMNLESIQRELQRTGLDGWLFFDHHLRDPLAYRVLELKTTGHVTRRWYYFIPARGEPRGLVHRVEPRVLETLPGKKTVYARWQEQETGLRDILSSAQRGGHAVLASMRRSLRGERRCRAPSNWCAAWAGGRQLGRTDPDLRSPLDAGHAGNALGGRSAGGPNRRGGL